MSEQAKAENWETLNVDEHLDLRQLQVADAPTLFELVDRNRDYLRKWLPWVDATRSSADSEAFIQEMLRRRHFDKEFGYGIFEDGQLAGHISLMGIGGGEAEVGYWVGQETAGRGIATRAVGGLKDLAFGPMGLTLLTLRANEKNVASLRVAEKAGFSKSDEHTVRDHFGQDATIFAYKLERLYETATA